MGTEVTSEHRELFDKVARHEQEPVDLQTASAVRKIASDYLAQFSWLGHHDLMSCAEAYVEADLILSAD